MSYVQHLTLPAWADDTLGRRWWEHRQAHPEVERLLVRFAREWRSARPGEQCSLKMLWERLRWETSVGDHSSRRDYRLNNTHTALWSRWLMEQYPDLAEPPLFVTRQRSSAEGAPPNPTRGPNGGENGARTTSRATEPLPAVEIPSVWVVFGSEGRVAHLVKRSQEHDSEAEAACGRVGWPFIRSRASRSFPRCEACKYRMRQLIDDPQPVDDDGDNVAPESVL